MSTTLALPPIPSLEQKHFQHRVIDVPHFGTLEALVPAAEPYICRDKNAPALLLLPGMGMDGLGFLRQLPLGAISRLQFFQMPNEPAAGETGLGNFARNVEEYVKAAGLHEGPGLFLGGCSMGGAVALATALRGRVPLRGLILLGTFGDCRHLPFWQRLFAPCIRLLPLGRARDAARGLILHTQFFGHIKPDEADWLVSCKLDRTRTYYVNAVMSLTRQRQIPAARELKLPTLVLHGTKDHMLPYAAGVELANSIPGAKLVTVERGGHAFFFTTPEIVNSAIAEFIRTEVIGHSSLVINDRPASMTND
ncbi:MAG TPA: alpha/beta hydrolase [Planctomycetota bacterium]|jgi:pimeloyl-ACP methyl ester carboxylesterase